MVYISGWHKFQIAAEELYAKSPNTVNTSPHDVRTSCAYTIYQTRYCVKFKTIDGKGKLVLKITDDLTVRPSPSAVLAVHRSCMRQCIKFKTFSSIFLNRFEALNLSLIQKMQNVEAPPIPDISAAVATSSQNVIAGDSSLTGSAPITASAASNAGVKKKKAKKKK